MLWQFFSWYLALQLLTLAALPLTLRLFVNLPDRGYAFGKSVGILAVGFLFWLGYSYGLVRNEAGGAWLVLLLVAALSWILGRATLTHLRQRDPTLPGWRYVLGIEVIFLVTFALWALVRAYDPAVNHTEEPMDLMFLNSIWASATYPPQDAWLSGYAISYYYFGYWLLAMVGRLAAQPPEIVYTLGQASWYGLLWIGCFGLGYNLLAQRNGAKDARAVAGGLLAALLVAATGNFQAILEWLHANQVNVTGLARWFGVTNFPDNAPQTGLWYISYDWWWWRSSRVISDRLLDGGHLEVIDEFPSFSYILGDNHPHVLAMPFVILVLALLFTLFLSKRQLTPPVPPADVANTPGATLRHAASHWLTMARTLVPFGAMGIISLIVALGSLIFLNTWDFPPYWLLLVVTVALVWWRARRNEPAQSPGMRWGESVLAGVIGGVLVLVGAVVLYLPYFVTAQSQAGGIVPNLFNPTRLPQFLVMFGFALLALVALLGQGWQLLTTGQSSSSGRGGLQLGLLALLVYGLPIGFLAVSGILANTARGQALLAANQLGLPPGVASYWSIIRERWLSQFWTFLVLGLFLILVLWVIWRLIERFWATDRANLPSDVQATTLFVLLLAALGLLLVFAPEFVYLRDNFGSRMNTVFKFYYQAWLLFGLVTSYVVVAAFSSLRAPAAGNNLLRLGTNGCAILSLLIALSGVIFPLAAAYSKTGGFVGEPTFDATGYLATQGPNELAAVEWIRLHTPPTALIVEGKGASYRSDYNRISTMTGRPTLLGWDGHESQWRGKDYGEMAQGRPEALTTIYRSLDPNEIANVLNTWQIDYVYVGPSERGQYEISATSERALAAATNLAFEQGDVRIYQRRR